MDLDALDTAYGAEQIDSDLLLTDIRTGLEYTLRNKTYCGQDPFGKRRYGADAGDMCYVFGKENNILKLVINIALDGGYGINPLPRDVAAAILRDVSAAIKPIANKHSARAIIKKQPFGSAAMGARSGALFQSAALYGYIISTPYAKDTGIPDEKFIWDANRDIWCKRCGQIRDTRFAAGQKTDYTIQPSDFGKVFLLGGSLYRIIGMGETWEDRIDMALTLNELGIRSIPINILRPIPGTPLEHQAPLSEDEILRTIAIFRYINPTAMVRLAAGRNSMKHSGDRAFRSGANAAITGDMLTTSGNRISDDREMLFKMGFEL